jgi:hypothetical protein
MSNKSDHAEEKKNIDETLEKGTPVEQPAEEGVKAGEEGGLVLPPSETQDVRYVPNGKPDTAALSQLILAAKGDGRTMAQFAEACGNVPGVSPSTFSRILNRTVKRPLSTILLKTIARNAANPEIVTYDKLLVANGMIRADEFKYFGTSEGQQNRKELRKKHGYLAHAHDDVGYESLGPEEELAAMEELKGEERSMDVEMKSVMRVSARAEMEDVILSSLLNRGHLCAKTMYRLPKDELIPGGRAGNLVLRVQGEEPLYWAFNFVAPSDSYQPSPHMDGSVRWVPLSESNRRWIGMRFVDFYSAIFLRDMWKKETLKDVRVFFVLFDELLYNDLCEKMAKIKVNGHMSLILVDMEKGDVVSETMLSRISGKPLKSLFDQEKLYADDEMQDEKEDLQYDPWAEYRERRRD